MAFSNHCNDQSMNSLIITVHYTGSSMTVDVGSCCPNTQKISRELVKVSYSVVNNTAKSSSCVLRFMKCGRDFREVFSVSSRQASGTIAQAMLVQKQHMSKREAVGCHSECKCWTGVYPQLSCFHVFTHYRSSKCLSVKSYNMIVLCLHIK